MEGKPVRPGAFSALLQELFEEDKSRHRASWARPLEPGAVVGRFELVREVGRGGFGVVYEAKDRELGRAVAFKAVLVGDRPDVREDRLLREAEAAARLCHPNIVTIHDVGRSEYGPYMILELLHGQTLAQRLQQDSLTVHEALRIGVQIAKGLAHAHTRGVVHRDLTPGNIFLCADGQVKVLDLGMAHAFGRRKLEGGTPSYMAPEQWLGAPEDERTDVFALGVILYRMISGQLPFPDDGGKSLLGPAPCPALEVPEEPALGKLVSSMLARDPVKRPRDAGEVLAALEGFERELPSRPAAAPLPARRRTETNPETGATEASFPIYAFEGFVLDLDRGSLKHDGRDTGLRPQSFAVLYQLVKNARRLVGKAELQQTIWSGTSMTEDSLVQCISDIRRALGNRETMLRTIPRRGYMLDVDVVYRPTAVAVLPFMDLCDESGREEHLGDGLAEELITQLTRIPRLRVASRSASFRFRDSEPDLPAIGTALKVDSVIEGSVRRAADRLRISVRLVALPDGSQIWSETFDRPKGDIFALEDELAHGIAVKLQSGDETAPRARRRPKDPEAYRLYLTGCYFWNKLSGAALQKAISCWEGALKKEPRYALAYSGIAAGYTLLAYFGYRAPHEVFPRAEAAAMSALAIDEHLAGAHVSLANHRLHYAWDLGEARRELDRALALDPGSYHAYHVLSHYWVAAGDLDKSRAASLRALEIEPLDLVLIAHLGWHYLYAGSYELGVEACRRAIDMDPGFVPAHIYLGQLLTQMRRYEEATAALERAAELSGDSTDVQGHLGVVHALAGRRREALRVRDRLISQAKQRYVSAYHIGAIHLALRERDAAMTWFRRAISERSRFMVSARVDPILPRLLGARRFSQLMSEFETRS